MSYYVEIAGNPISQRASATAAYVIKSTVSLESAIAERPIASLAVRVPPGATNAPLALFVDFDEITIDYPTLPYRAWAERHADLVAYWRLDEAAVTLAVDSKGNTPLTYAGGNDLDHRAYRQEGAAVPYGAAPEWGHTSGAGLTGTLPASIGTSWTIAGWVRQGSGATGNRYIWWAGAGSRSLRLWADGSMRLLMEGETLNAAAGTISDDTWHHVAVTRSPTQIRLWVDGVVVVTDTPRVATPIDGVAWQMARAVGSDAVDLALDEWGIWSDVLDVAVLYARQDAYRAFGGYVYGVTDNTDLGPRDQHVLSLNCAGYGLRLDHSFVRQIYASASGMSVRAIVQDVLELAGLDAAFTSHGVELTDTVIRAVFAVESVMAILRSLADDHGAIVTVDEWREIDIVRRSNVENSPLVLSGGRTGNVARIGRQTQPRFFASRAVVVGRGERGVVEDERTGDGATTVYDASQPIGSVLSVTVDGVEQEFSGTGARWEPDTGQQRFELASGETPVGVGKTIKFAYVSAEALVVSVDNATAITSIGFPVARRYEDDSIDDVSVARVVAQARLDRHDQRFEEFEAVTIPGRVKRIRPGVAPTWNFPRQGLSNVRLLVERVSSRLGVGGADYHPVVHTITGTALDYPGDVGDDYRQTYLPPAPRPEVPVTADPNQTIIRPGNVAVPVSLPIRLGGEVGVPIRTTAWETPDGAVLTRVSGHEIAVPLALSVMAKCLPRDAIGTGQQVEIRLWDATTGAAIGSAVTTDSTTAERLTLRAIILPLREFDLTYQARVVSGLRGGAVWGVTLHLDLG